MTEKDKIIEKMMSNLNITRDEAERLYLFDNDEIENDEAEALTEKAKGNRHYEKGESKRKASEPKERKIDPDKKYLHTLIHLALQKEKVENKMPFSDIVPKNEAEISFTFNGGRYTIKLTKHRK